MKTDINPSLIGYIEIKFILLQMLWIQYETLMVFFPVIFMYFSIILNKNLFQMILHYTEEVFYIKENISLLLASGY